MTMSLKAILSAINITKVNNMKPHKHAALIAEAVQDMTKQIYLKTPKPQFTPEQLQSVLYTIMKCQDMARYERDYSLQDELTEAIALLKGMK